MPGMKISISPKTKQLIDDWLKSGQYETAEDVIAAALSQLSRQEEMDDFEPGELDSFLKEGEQSGDALDGEQVLSGLSRLGTDMK